MVKKPAKKVLMFTALAAFTLLIPSLAVMGALTFVTYILLKKLKRARHGGWNFKLKVKWSLPSRRLKLNELKKLGKLEDCIFYMPEGRPSCIICFKGLTLMGVGYISLKPLKPSSIDIVPLMQACLRMRRQLTLALIASPSSQEQLKITTLIAVRAARRCLSVDEDQIESLVDEVEHALNGVGAILVSQPYPMELEVLSGRDLVDVSLLMVGGSG